MTRPGAIGAPRVPAQINSHRLAATRDSAPHASAPPATPRSADPAFEAEAVPKIRLLIADDHDLVRSGLRAISNPRTIWKSSPRHRTGTARWNSSAPRHPMSYSWM